MKPRKAKRLVKWLSVADIAALPVHPEAARYPVMTEEELRNALGQFPHLPVCASTALPGFADAQIVQPSAAILGRLAAAGAAISARGDLEPIYLREPHITRPKPRVVPGSPS